MIRRLLLLAALAVCGACGGTPAAETSGGARCGAAVDASRAAADYAEKLQEQAPAFELATFYRDVERGRVDTTGLGIIESQQMSFQVISDNSECFTVSVVADARRRLKVIDPAVLEATRILAAGSSE